MDYETLKNVISYDKLCLLKISKIFFRKYFVKFFLKVIGEYNKIRIRIRIRIRLVLLNLLISLDFEFKEREREVFLILSESIIIS